MLNVDAPPMDVDAPPVGEGTGRQPGDFDMSDSGYGGSHGHLERWGDVVKV